LFFEPRRTANPGYFVYFAHTHRKAQQEFNDKVKKEEQRIEKARHLFDEKVAFLLAEMEEKEKQRIRNPTKHSKSTLLIICD
jgi:uncharacterized membrane protein